MYAINELYDEIYDSDGYPLVYDQAFVFGDDEEEDELYELEELVRDTPAPNSPPAQA